MIFNLKPTNFFLEQLDNLSFKSRQLLKDKLELLKLNPTRNKRILGYNLFLFRIRFSDSRKEKRVIYLLDKKDRSVLYKFARSKNLWEKRISIISTLWFIRNNKFNDTLKISEILLKDSHDLIHKAVGWMLREVGKKDQGIEEKFLKKHYKKMPRTMLRYAIEKFDEVRRKKYLKGDI